MRNVFSSLHRGVCDFVVYFDPELPSELLTGIDAVTLVIGIFGYDNQQSCR